MSKSLFYFVLAILSFASVNSKKELKFYQEKVSILFLHIIKNFSFISTIIYFTF